jgi:hypothetical protein
MQAGARAGAVAKEWPCTGRVESARAKRKTRRAGGSTPGLMNQKGRAPNATRTRDAEFGRLRLTKFSRIEKLSGRVIHWRPVAGM